MEKALYRENYRKLRADLSPQERKAKSAAICATALDFLSHEHSMVHCFLPITRLLEVDTFLIAQTIIDHKDKQLVCSRSDLKTTTMTHHRVSSLDILEYDTWNIPQPTAENEVRVSKLDIVFVPLLAIDRNGNRLGYGKGFYDRFLSALPPEVPKIGLSFFPPTHSDIPVNQHDIPLDGLITPEAIYRF